MANEFEQEWDDKMDCHMAAVRKGQEIMARALIKEIRDYNYQSIVQVNSALVNHLNRLQGEG